MFGIPKKGGQNLSASRDWNPVLEQAQITANTVGGRGIRVSTMGPHRQISLSPGASDYYPALICDIKNVGEKVVLPYCPLKITGQAFVTGYEGEKPAADRQTKARIILKGRRPHQGDTPGLWAIAAEAIPPDRIGRCWVGGICPAEIESTATETAPAECEIDTDGVVNDALVFARGGTGQVISPQGAVTSGTRYIAVIQLPGAPRTDERWIRISGIDTALGNGQWIYTAEEVEKTGQGYGGWTAALVGWSGLAYNETEEVLNHNLQAAPAGLIRRARFIQTTDGYTDDIEAWFEYENCCESVPCDDCEAATPGATVTVSGSCDACCSQYTDTYSFFSYSETESGCTWSAVGYNNGGILSIVYTIATGQWEVRLWDLCSSSDFIDLDTDVMCSGGALVGSFTLPAGAACSGCTADVTLT